MIYLLLADAVVLVHLAYIVFVLAGAVLVRYRPSLVWVHVAAVLWGVFIAVTNGVCPLTPLEVSLRIRAGQRGYSGGFVEHYLLPVLYPRGLTRAVLTVEALLVIAVNVALYIWVWRVRTREARG